MNEVKETEEKEKEEKAKEAETVVPFSHSFAAPQLQPTTAATVTDGHVGRRQWPPVEAESGEAQEWLSFGGGGDGLCGSEVITSVTTTATSSECSANSGQRSLLNFLGVVGQQQQQHQQHQQQQQQPLIRSSSHRKSSIHHRHHQHRRSCKRIRTTFERSQLDTLRECFKRSHKPNSAQLCTLVHRTGLSKRVIQVSSETGYSQQKVVSIFLFSRS